MSDWRGRRESEDRELGGKTEEPGEGQTNKEQTGGKLEGGEWEAMTEEGESEEQEWAQEVI